METKVGATITILFVDDEGTIRKSFARELLAEGFSVTAAASGSEAISLLESRSFDLVITDLMMPEVDGFAVLKAAKKLEPSRPALSSSPVMVTCARQLMPCVSEPTISPRNPARWKNWFFASEPAF